MSKCQICETREALRRPHLCRECQQAVDGCVRDYPLFGSRRVSVRELTDDELRLEAQRLAVALEASEYERLRENAAWQDRALKAEDALARKVVLTDHGYTSFRALEAEVDSLRRALGEIANHRGWPEWHIAAGRMLEGPAPKAAPARDVVGTLATPR